MMALDVLPIAGLREDLELHLWTMVIFGVPAAAVATPAFIAGFITGLLRWHPAIVPSICCACGVAGFVGIVILARTAGQGAGLALLIVPILLGVLMVATPVAAGAGAAGWVIAGDLRDRWRGRAYPPDLSNGTNAEGT